jgi:hypothetical protein
MWLPAAIEILYHLSQYFGWVYRIYRYGPYTKDPRVVELIRELGKTWSSRRSLNLSQFVARKI